LEICSAYAFKCFQCAVVGYRGIRFSAILDDVNRTEQYLLLKEVKLGSVSMCWRGEDIEVSVPSWRILVMMTAFSLDLHIKIVQATGYWDPALLNLEEVVIMKLHLSSINKAIISGMAVMMVSGSAYAGSIAGSLRDMSNETWNGGDPVNGIQGQICNVCHAPHGGANAALGPLWNHDVPTHNTYTMYTSPLNTLDGAMLDAAPSGASFLCLSCHDGTVALNAFGGQTGGANMTYIGARFQLGSDLSNDHPIGVEYNDTTAGADGELKIPSTATQRIGGAVDFKDGTVLDTMLDGGATVQCNSCHDVHNHFTDGDKFLKVTKTGSAICLACHIK